MARFALLFALVLPVSAGARVSSFEFFQTPSHNIACAYSTSPQSLRCDIRSGLKPAPPKPIGCQSDWTFGFQAGPQGRARTVCAGDTVFSPGARVLRYGSAWVKGPFTCRSERAGLVCSNGSRHGFLLSREYSTLFGPPESNNFRTPSGKIGCNLTFAPPVFLECEVSGGIKPRPPKPQGCKEEWAPGYDLPRRGEAAPYCSGGTILVGHRITLRYGQSWKRHGFSCTSRRKGLTCRNVDGHGIFLSVGRSYRF